jgi:excisionase family DNA binding protein
LLEREGLVAIEADEWLSLGEASARLGVHPNTMRRWANAGAVPCCRTPGGHRRFRAADLRRALVEHSVPAPHLAAGALVQKVVVYTRQRLGARPVRDEPWRAAFRQAEERQQMREMGRRLLGLAIATLRRTRELAPLVAEGRRIGQWVGERCADRGVSLVDTARSFCFFRSSVLQATSEMREDVTNTAQVPAHIGLVAFLDEVMYACLAGYEAASRRLRPPESAA